MLSRPSNSMPFGSGWQRFAPYERPVGDRWGNRGLFTAAGGNFDHKLTELITNMLDSLLLRRAVEAYGDDVLNNDESAELFETPAQAVRELFGVEGPPSAPVRPGSNCDQRDRIGSANERSSSATSASACSRTKSLTHCCESAPLERTVSSGLWVHSVEEVLRFCQTRTGGLC